VTGRTVRNHQSLIIFMASRVTSLIAFRDHLTDRHIHEWITPASGLSSFARIDITAVR